MILIRSWLVHPRCFKDSVCIFQVPGFCFSRCWIVLKMQKYPSDALRSHHKFVLRQEGTQSSCYSPFASSGQVWMGDIVTLTSSEPACPLFHQPCSNHTLIFRPSLLSPSALHWFICFLLLLIFGNVAPQRFSQGLMCSSPCPFTRRFLTTSAFQTHFAVSLYLAANECQLRYNWKNGISSLFACVWHNSGEFQAKFLTSPWPVV